MACMLQVSRIFDLCRPRSKRYTNKCTVSGEIEFISDELEGYHGFAHGKVSKCLKDLLDTSEEIRNLLLSYTVEVYHFEDYTTTLQQLKCHFMIKVLSFDNEGKISNVFCDFIRNINVSTHRNHKQFKYAMLKQLKIRSLKIRVTSINSTQKTNNFNSAASKVFDAEGINQPGHNELVFIVNSGSA